MLKYFLFLFSLPLFAQTNANIVFVVTAPSGACQTRANVRLRVPSGVLYTCVNNVWVAATAGGGGPGTVTSVSGTTNQISVATGTTTPVISLANNTAIPGNPTTTTQSTGDSSTIIATTAYVSGALASINPAVSVEAATTGVLSNTPTYNNGTAGVGATLTAGSAGVLTVDGYTPALNEPILVKNQASSLQNGIYTLTTVGTGGVAYVLTRRTDYNAPSNINYTGTIPVLLGSTNANTGWNLNTQIATLGTDPLTYTQAAAGNAGGPPGGNVKAQGNLASGNALKGAGGKTIIDSGLTFGAVNLPSPGATCTFSTGSTICVCTTTCTITVPVPVAGYQFCVLNDDNVATVITLSAIGSSARYERTARTAYGTAGTGTLVSSGAVGDAVCIVGRDSTHYLTTNFTGTWTAN